MAFNPLEYLKDGKVDFVFNCTQYDYEHLIERVRKVPNRIEIINGFLPKLKEELPSFCFSIIYDIPEFANEAYELLNIKNITPKMLNNMLYNSPLGDKTLEENFDLLINNKEYFDVVVKYAFDSDNKVLLHKLSRYSNLHTRFLFMKYLIKNHPEKINDIYDDITKYMTSVTYEPLEQMTFLPELMDSEDISKLAVQLLVNNQEEDYEKLKQYILKEYKYNHLASELLNVPTIEDTNRPGLFIIDDKNKLIQENAFIKDSNSLFITSSDYRFHILFDHNEKIKQELLDNFSSKMRCFLEAKRNDESLIDNNKWDLKQIDNCGLSGLLEEWTEKYMDLSKSKEYGFIGNGTTCSCYRIGDYVIKLVKTKWSYEDVICPNLYLIAKDYEEIYIRNKNGVVQGGLEVQKYLTRSAKDIDPKYFEYFDLALDRLGYMRTDTLTKGSCGENTMLLDTYLDADCPNPENVPVWFRQYPLVLIDRDRIYPKNRIYVKQLSAGY